MSEQRVQTMKRLVHALDSTNTASHIMSVYLDEDRQVVVEATREEVSEKRLVHIIDKNWSRHIVGASAPVTGAGRAEPFTRIRQLPGVVRSSGEGSG